MKLRNLLVSGALSLGLQNQVLANNNFDNIGFADNVIKIALGGEVPKLDIGYQTIVEEMYRISEECRKVLLIVNKKGHQEIFSCDEGKKGVLVSTIITNGGKIKGGKYSCKDLYLTITFVSTGGKVQEILQGNGSLIEGGKNITTSNSCYELNYF